MRVRGDQGEDKLLDEAEGVVLAAGEGEVVTEERARSVVIKTAHPLLDVTWSRYEPGERGPDRHLHERHVDAFFVLAGELLFELGGLGPAIAASAGTFVAVPQGVVHTFGNESDRTATFLNFHAPSCGFADSLRGRDVPFDSAEAPWGRGREPGEVIVRSADGDRPGRDEVDAHILVELPELSALLIGFEPAFTVRPHAHDDHLDSFFLLDGEVELTLGGRVVRPGRGAWAAAPPGVVHGFANAGSRRAQLLNVHAPDAGFAASIRRRRSQRPGAVGRGGRQLPTPPPPPATEVTSSSGEDLPPDPSSPGSRG